MRKKKLLIVERDPIMIMDLESGIEESVANLDIIFARSITDALQMALLENNDMDSALPFDLAIIEILDLTETSRSELATLFKFCKAAILTKAAPSDAEHEDTGKITRIFVRPYRLSDIIDCAVDRLSTTAV